MKKGASYIAQTINLSNVKTSARPKPIPKDLRDVCGKRGPSHQTTRPSTVRVCKREDIERSCQAKRDDSATVQCSSSVSPVCKAITFVVKSAVAAGLVYWTYSEGLWGDGEQAEDLYCRILSSIAPMLPEDPDIELPHYESLKYSIVEKYNAAVYKIMDSLTQAPSILRGKIDELLSADEKSTGEEDSTKKR